MRQKRAKSYRKQMLVYSHTFKFREPYQVIVDEQIVLACEQSKFDLAKGLSRTLQAEVKPMITQCCMQALYATDNQPAITIAKEFERRRCNHPPSAPLAPHECIKSIVVIKGVNKHRYVVASGNEQLRWSLRKTPGIPIIYMNRSVMVMEPLSKGTAEINTEKEESKLRSGLNSLGGKDTEKKTDATQPSSKKRKGPKEPNPLSVLKKKKKVEANPKPEEKKRRKRTHKKTGEEGQEGTKDESEGKEGATKESEDSGNKETSVEKEEKVTNSE